MKNRKQRIVAGFIALLILLFCSSISFSAAKEPVATSAPVATVTVEVTPEPEPTPSPETKINYSDTIQVLVTPELKQKIEYLVSTYDNEIIMATKVMIAEAGGVYPLSHRAAVVWCILNRADATGNSISSIITAPNQFAWIPSQAYNQKQYDFVKDIFTRWLLEKEGFENVGRVLPEEYKWFRGDGSQNHFRNAYSGSYTIWNWSFQAHMMNKSQVGTRLLSVYIDTVGAIHVIVPTFALERGEEMGTYMITRPVLLPMNSAMYARQVDNSITNLSAVSADNNKQAILDSLDNTLKDLEIISKNMLSFFNVKGNTVEEREKALSDKLKQLQAVTANLNGFSYENFFGQKLRAATKIDVKNSVSYSEEYNKFMAYLTQACSNTLKNDGIIDDKKIQEEVAKEVYKYINNSEVNINLSSRDAANGSKIFFSNKGTAFKLTTDMFDLTKFTRDKFIKFFKSDKYKQSLRNSGNGVTLTVTGEIPVNQSTIYDFLRLKYDEFLMIKDADKYKEAIKDQFINTLLAACPNADKYLRRAAERVLSTEEGFKKLFVGNNPGNLKGLIGEIQAMYYTMSLFKGKTEWVGGTFSSGLQPHADLVISRITEGAKKSYGVQVKNVIGDEVDFKSFGASKMESGHTIDFTDAANAFTLETGIDQEIFNSITNILAMRHFNVPYKKGAEKYEVTEVSNTSEFFASKYEELHNNVIDEQISRILSQYVTSLMYIQMKEEMNEELQKQSNTLYIIGGIKAFTSYRIVKQLREDLENNLASQRLRIRAEYTGDKGSQGTIIEVLNHGGKRHESGLAGNFSL